VSRTALLDKEDSLKNKGLIRDYMERSVHRLAAIDLLYERKSWADVVRESQEVVELALKALVRSLNIEVPRIHDVGDILLENQSRVPQQVRSEVEKLAEASHTLRRDRELAFYGSEDLTPSQFYKKKHADEARKLAKFVVSVVKDALPKP